MLKVTFRQNLLYFASLIIFMDGLYFNNDFHTSFLGFYFFLLLLLLFRWCCCCCFWFHFIINIIIIVINLFLLVSGLMLFPGKKYHNGGHQLVVLGIVAFFSFFITLYSTLSVVFLPIQVS